MLNTAHTCTCSTRPNVEVHVHASGPITSQLEYTLYTVYWKLLDYNFTGPEGYLYELTYMYHSSV